MIKASETVENILLKDELALESLRAGILNLSAYAQKIHPEVVRQALKPVRKGTIVVALSRFVKNINNISPLKPKVIIQDLSIKSPLFEVTFEKTSKNLKRVSELPKTWFTEGFITITEGVGEITIIIAEKMKQQLLNHFNVKPKGQYSDLVAVTIRFKEEDYVDEPNMIFTLVSALASKRINLKEVVSTFTEISFIVKQSDRHSTTEALQQFFDKSNQ